jgi:hypothetical protein
MFPVFVVVLAIAVITPRTFLATWNSEEYYTQAGLAAKERRVSVVR